MTPETRVRNAFDDVAISVCQALSAGVEAIEQAFDRIIQDKLKSRKKQKAGLRGYLTGCS